ncbi:hypothetical protein J437_LFUL017872, partial [Ladona fulva]
DQFNAWDKTVRTVSKWSYETIEKALNLRLACGTNGYNILLDSGYPLPSERTVTCRLENINFCPGFLKENFPSFRQKLQLMSPLEGHAVLTLDEMNIEPALEILTGNSCTTALNTRGMSTQWKQTVDYLFTGPSFCAREQKEVMFDLIMNCQELGLRLWSQNQALWKEGIGQSQEN